MNADYSETEKIGRRMQKCCATLHGLVSHVALARQVKEYASDRKKNVLAKYVAVHLKAGETSTAAETLARADPLFQKELEQLEVEYETAMKVMAEWEAEMCSFEAARSLLSFQKATIRELEPA